jgi:hypothetical protein
LRESHVSPPSVVDQSHLAGSSFFAGKCEIVDFHTFRGEILAVSPRSLHPDLPTLMPQRGPAASAASSLVGSEYPHAYAVLCVRPRAHIARQAEHRRHDTTYTPGVYPGPPGLIGFPDEEKCDDFRRFPTIFTLFHRISQKIASAHRFSRSHPPEPIGFSPFECPAHRNPFGWSTPDTHAMVRVCAHTPSTLSTPAT